MAGLRIVIAFALLVLVGAAAARPLEDGIAALDGGQYQAAYRSFLKGSEAGDAESQVQLAEMLLEGRGVAKDQRSAVLWLQKAADRNHAYAAYRLGTLIEEGKGGKADPALAARWYEKATQGEPNAAWRLGRLYEKGLGVPVNQDRAISLYREAAMGGVLKADHALGSALARRGPENLGESAMWLELAAQGGDADIVAELNQVRARLTADQQRAVKARVESHLRTSRHHYGVVPSGR